MLPRTTDAAAPLPRGRSPRPFRSLPWSILLTAAVIAAASGLYLRGQLVSRRSAEAQKLLAIADLKAREVERWREDLERHAASVARRTDVAQLARQRLDVEEHAADAGERASALLGELAIGGRYDSALLLSLDGRTLASSRGARAELHPEVGAAALAAIDGRRIAVAEPVVVGGGLRVVTTVLVNGPDGRPIAAVVMESAAEEAALRDLRRWPIPSATGEIRVVRRGAPESQVPGGAAADALSRAVPLSLAWEIPSSPVALAALGRTGLVHAEEADGREVMAALRPIGGTGWALVASVDFAEVDEPTWSVAGQVAATALSLLVAIAAGLALAARRGASELRAREAALERAQLEAQLSRAERMASLGTLAAGMAHELNSPLASVLANARFAAGELRARPGADLDEVTEALDDAVEATERAAAVVRSLDVFATAGADATRIAELRREVSGATRAVNEPRRPQLVKARRSA